MLEATLKRHVITALFGPYQHSSNVQNDRLNVYENVSHVPMSVNESIPPVNDDVDSATLPVNPGSVAMRRSGRPKKPVERSVAGSKQFFLLFKLKLGGDVILDVLIIVH